MNATQFAKAQKLFDRVKELDAEILEIEKTAQLIASNKTEIKLSLKINDLEKHGKKQRVLDEDGSLLGDSPIGRNPFSLFFGLDRTQEQKSVKEYDVKQDSIIPDRVALQVLGVLLADKMEARDLAIKRLNKIGIDI